MPSFAYEALDARGGAVGGTCEAADVRSAAGMLRASGLHILEIREAAAERSAGRSRGVPFWGALCPVTYQELIQFYRHMSLMLGSGVPLLHAVEVFRGQCRNPRLAAAADRVAERIQGGASFSAALEPEQRLFLPMAVRMIATGEVTGELGTILDRIAMHLEQKSTLRGTLLTSLAYPAVVVLATVGVVLFLVMNVIPKFMHILDTRNVPLPPFTKALVDITAFLNEHGLAILGGILGAIVVVMAVRLTRTGRYAVDRALLAVPLIGSVLTLAFLADLGRMLAILLRSGVPLIDQLRTLSEHTHNRVFAAYLRRAEQEVLEGRPLSKGLQARFIPAVLSEVVSVGEATGRLDGVLDEAGGFFERKLQRKVRWMTTFIEPALILGVGGIVGLVYIAFFQVLYQMTAG